MDKLSEKEIIIFYERDNCPPLRKDSIGNFIVELGTNNLFYTSTSFKEIKNCKTVYCFNNQSFCYYNDLELEKVGYEINLYSNFTTDTNNIKKYINPYDIITIMKIKN
jgi:hypothetical protein